MFVTLFGTYDTRMSDFVLLCDEPLDVDDARRRVTSPTAGAVAMFIGRSDIFYSPRKLGSHSQRAEETTIVRLCSTISTF